MSHNILVKLAPILDADRWDDPTWTRPGRTLYWPHSLRLLPGKPTPLVVDHDMERVFGTVTGLSTMPFTDGQWIVAGGVVDDAPSWLKTYRTKASFGHWTVHSTPHANGCERVTSAIVQEVSLLRDHQPAEPLAAVVLLRHAPAAVSSQAPAGAAPRVFYGGPTIRRYFPATFTVR